MGGVDSAFAAEARRPVQAGAGKRQTVPGVFYPEQLRDDRPTRSFTPEAQRQQRVDMGIETDYDD